MFRNSLNSIAGNSTRLGRGFCRTGLLAGFVVLMMLMVTVIYNDLTRISWIERLMPWR